MIKNKKTLCKIISVFLSFLIVVQIFPLQVLAENIANLFQNNETTDATANENNNVSILYEIEEKRDEYTKVYKKSDGTYTAIMTEEPLHYLNDGVWEEINNSMSLNGNLYTNLDNLFNVELPETIDSNENLTVEKDGYEISFSVDNIEESSAVVENDIVVSDTNVPVADEAIAQTQSSVTYNDVAEDTDLQYIVTPNSIKENIIVSNKESVKETYTFTFETNGLDVEKLDDGSVIFKDENSEIKFRIPRPVMTDSGLAHSYDINVVLTENTDDTITLEYSPSSEWINSSDRTYPITIDPAIVVENNNVSWVEDTWVSYDSSIKDSEKVNGYYDCAGGVINQTSVDADGKTVYQDAEIYSKFNIDALKSLGDNIVFTEVQYLFVGASVDGKALAKEISSPVDLTTVTHKTKPELNDEIIDYYTSPYSSNEMINGLQFSYIHFNLTKPLNEWYNGGENNGFAIVSGNEEYIGIFCLNGTQTSSAGATTTYTTFIVMDYVDMGGYNENLNYHSQTVGRAGTGYVNDFTQQLSVIRDDINFDDNKMPVTIGMIYNSATFNKMKSLNYDTMMAYGNKWTPNYLRAFVQMSDNQLTYFTENGSEIDYTYSVINGEVVFEEMYSSIYGNHKYKIEYFPATSTASEYIVITRPDGCEERFNELGLLTSVTNPDYPSQNISIVYDSMYRIDYITDGVGRQYKYIYCKDTNLLSTIRCYNSKCTHTISSCKHTIIDISHSDECINKTTNDESLITNCSHDSECMHDTTASIHPATDCESSSNDCTHEGNCIHKIVYCKHTDDECKHKITDCKPVFCNCIPITAGTTEFPLEVNYQYDVNNNLIKITFPDGKSASYTYDEKENITSIVNIDGYRIEYNYGKVDDKENEIPQYTNKITKVTEKTFDGEKYIDGKFITYERLNTNQIKLTDATGDYEIYHFGISGNLLYTIDNDGNYVMHEDVREVVNSTEETHFASVSDYRAFSENLLSNPSFEETKYNNTVLRDWEVQTKVLAQTNKAKAIPTKDEPALFGVNVLKINCYKNHTIGVKQSVNIFSSGYYTLSAYVKAETTEKDALKLKISYDNESNDSTAITSVTTTDGKWERYTATIFVPEGTNKIEVELIAENSGTFYIDGVQLEQSLYASSYNYVSNGAFNKKFDNWTTTNTISPTGSTINGKDVNAIEITENIEEETIITQTVTIDGIANDIIRVGGWFNGNFNSSSTNNVWLKNIMKEPGNKNICNFTYDRYACIEVICEYDDSDITELITIPFAENINDWQFAAKEFTLQKNCSKIIIKIRGNQLVNTAMFSGFEVTKTKIRANYMPFNKCSCKHCINPNCTCKCTSEKDCKCKTCQHEWQCPCIDCTVVDCSCNCTKGSLCYCTQCIRKNKNTKTENFANISLGNNYDEIVTSQLLSQRIGDNVTVNYNLSNGLFKTYVDATMNFTSYNYNNSGVLTQISANDNKIDFTYENDRITAIKQNATIYKFNYDSWGQITQISIGDTPIVSYQYDSEEYRDRIIKVTYYNDDSSHSISKFNYDDESNSIIITVNDKEKFTCIFDKNGSLIEIQEKDGRKINYINDEINISDIENNQIYKLEIDSNGSYVETIGESNFTTEIDSLYNSNCEYKNTVKISVNSEKSIIAEAEFDAIGRYYPSTAAQITNNSEPQVAVGTGYEYYDFDTNSSNSTTNNQNFKTIVSETISYSEVSELLNWYTFNYNYDNNNNIIYESICDKYEEKNIYYECYYSYDESNQLVRVNQKSYPIQDYIYVEGNRYNTSPIITPEKSFTCTYEYDKAGNLRYKREYEYTTDETLENHTPINVIVYGYNSNNEWQDQLMSYGSVSIDYDDIGNPISIGDKQLTWNGKQLKTYTDGDKVINYEYDVNGLCHKKTITHDNATETYDYIWSEGKLTGQIYADSASSKYAIKYVYDLFNAPYGFIISNNNHERMYLYLKNIKGDIIGVINEEGEMVITYEYDAWGKLSHPYADDSDEFANVINILPITYRGYFYDYDIGLYYIQGRYYNPEWGRFINADSTSNLGSTGTALSYNLYAYCENNPVMYVVDNKNTAFSNTINANYLYNKRISKGITGYIDDQGNGIASKLRYGINTIAPFGCGTVATYNALIMLGNRIEISEIIRDYEMNYAYHYGLIGTHGNNIARFFTEKGYNVTITNLENLDFSDKKQLSDINETITTNDANILYYKGGSTGHFIAISYVQDSQGKYIYKTYNENKTVCDVSYFIGDFIPKEHYPYMLISISNE